MVFMESHLSIDEVAKRTGLTAHTLRYYERIGLIAPVARAAGGQRRYAASDMAWIEFLLRLRTTNMPISKMLSFASLRSAGDSTVTERRHILEAHLAEVLAEIEAMRQAASALQSKIEHYRSLEQSPASNLPFDEGVNDDQSRSLRTRSRKTA
jgi:DNA-binding transcriptional MerR regulator